MRSGEAARDIIIYSSIHVFHAHTATTYIVVTNFSEILSKKLIRNLQDSS